MDWIIPWLEKERQLRPNIQLLGPVPPDTLWVSAGQAWYHPKTKPSYPDAYLALYHDQGLDSIEVISLSTRQSIRPLALPFIRTSPDHGTAFDIAGQGIARSESLKSAINLATEMLRAPSIRIILGLKAVKCIQKDSINEQHLFRNNHSSFNSH